MKRHVTHKAIESHFKPTKKPRGAIKNTQNAMKRAQKITKQTHFKVTMMIKHFRDNHGEMVAQQRGMRACNMDW